jgi:O-antigen/teichoic acid export membrane protein
MKKLPVLSATSWVMTKTIFAQMFAVLLFAIQAPILGPRAFGLISVVMVFIRFCEVVLGEAVAEALISLRKIENAHFDTMNTINLIVSAVCGVMVFAGATSAARLYGDGELAPILRWLAILPIISLLAVAPTAATKRDHQFKPLALRTMASVFLGGAVGLVLTVTGYGVWALVWQAIVTRLIATIVLWMAVPLPLRFGFSKSCLQDLKIFVLPTLLSRVMSWGSNQFPRLVFGFYWGVSELGLFGLASRLCDIVSDIALVPRYSVARVELRHVADDAPALRDAVGRLFLNMSVIAFPLSVGGAAVMPTLIHTWLNSRWYAGIVPSELLLLTGVPFVTLYCAGAVLLASNNQRAEVLMSIAQTLMTVIVVFVSAPLGLLFATAAFALRPFILVPLAVKLVQDRCSVPVRLMLAAQRPPFIAAAVMGVTVTGLRLGVEPYLRAMYLLPTLIVVGGAIYCAMLWYLIPDFTRQFMARLRSDRVQAALP